MSVPVLSDETIEEIVYAVLNTGHVDDAKAAVRAVLDKATAATTSAPAAPALSAEQFEKIEKTFRYVDQATTLASRELREAELCRVVRNLMPNIKAAVAAPVPAEVGEDAPTVTTWRLAVDGLLNEWDKLTRYGSPMARQANEAVAFARRLMEQPLSAPRPSRDDAGQEVAWQPIETAPLDQEVLLYCPELGIANHERIELGTAGTSRGSYHAWATKWAPLPAFPGAHPPAPSAEAGRVGELIRQAHDKVLSEIGEPGDYHDRHMLDGIERLIAAIDAALSGGAK